MSQYSSALRIAAAVVTCAALAGCAGLTKKPPTVMSPTSTVGETAAPAVSATAPPPSIAEIRASLARPANAKPYSATTKTRSLVEGEQVMVVVGRINFNSQLSGHMKFRLTEPGGDGKVEKGEIVITRQATYVRSGDPIGKWQRGSGQQGEALSVANFDGYVRFLLKKGPAAVKGQKWFNGVPATRISGRIKTAQIKDLDPNLYGRLRKADVGGLVADLWVDRKGRVVRVEQRFVAQELKFQNIVTLTKFRGVQTFRAPTS